MEFQARDSKISLLSVVKSDNFQYNSVHRAAFSSGCITAIVVNIPKRKPTKCTSVQWDDGTMA